MTCQGTAKVIDLDCTPSIGSAFWWKSFIPGMMWRASSNLINHSSVLSLCMCSAISPTKTCLWLQPMMLSHSLIWLVLPSSLSAVCGCCPLWCALTVSEGVMFQRWVAFPVLIDCCEAALDDTAFRHISSRRRLDRTETEDWKSKEGKMLRLHLAHSWTWTHRSQPQPLPVFSSRYHWKRANNNVRGKTADSSISNAFRSLGREGYMGYNPE